MQTSGDRGWKLDVATSMGRWDAGQNLSFLAGHVRAMETSSPLGIIKNELLCLV